MRGGKFGEKCKDWVELGVGVVLKQIKSEEYLMMIELWDRKVQKKMVGRVQHFNNDAIVNRRRTRVR